MLPPSAESPAERTMLPLFSKDFPVCSNKSPALPPAALPVDITIDPDPRVSDAPVAISTTPV